MIQKLTIVGVGLLGGSIGLAVRERKLAKQVVGVEINPHTRAEATTRRAVEQCTDRLGLGVVGADMVVLASPVSAILEDIARLKPTLAEGAVVTDIGSVKSAIALAGQSLQGAFVPGHPMAGGTHGGVAAAHADLFEGATWALTPDATTSPEALKRVCALVEGLGARVLLLSAEEHDRSVAVTSHLPHLLAYALSATAGLTGSEAALEAASFREGTRVCASPPGIWREICLENRKALGDALDLCIGELDAMLKALDRGEGEALEVLLRKGYRDPNL